MSGKLGYCGVARLKGAVVPNEGDAGARVLDTMEAALEMLDVGGYPADIGAHLDLAICRLREHLGFPLPSIDFGSDLGPDRLAM